MGRFVRTGAGRGAEKRRAGAPRCVLPGFDGYEVAARIRAAPACSASKLIALTGYAQNEFRARAQIAGFHAYLTKPVDMDALAKFIAGDSLQ